MGATNTTTYYNLSQFISTDKPAWLQDYNGDMLKIDTAINAAKVAADAAALAAGTAQSTADGAVNSVSTLSSTVSTHTTQITNLSGAVNTINSLIGNGTPTTTDQTIIGAINEINAKVPNVTQWADINNTHTIFIKEIDDQVVITFNSADVSVGTANTFQQFINANGFPLPKYEIVGSCVNGADQSENELIKIATDGSALISSPTTGTKYLIGSIVYPKA